MQGLLGLFVTHSWGLLGLLFVTHTCRVGLLAPPTTISGQQAGDVIPVLVTHSNQYQSNTHHVHAAGWHACAVCEEVE